MNMSTIEKLSQEISNLTILEAAELVQYLEKKWGIKAQIHANSNNDMNKNTSTNDENSRKYNIELTSTGQKKIQVIKLVRELTSLGLKEAKQLVDQIPKIIKKDVSKEEANEITSKFEKLGASVILK